MEKLKTPLRRLFGKHGQIFQSTIQAGHSRPGSFLSRHTTVLTNSEKKKVPELEIDDTMEEIIPENSPLPEHEVTRQEEELRLKKLLTKLNELDRAAVILRYWYDFSDHEIAENLSLSESAVKSRLFRARKDLALLWHEFES